MTALRLTPAAQGDLSDIWDFTAANWDVAQAELYVRELHAAMARIAADPSRGRACDEVRQGYRRYSIGSHIVYFLERPDGVDVVRILHQRMDPLRHL